MPPAKEVEHLSVATKLRSLERRAVMHGHILMATSKGFMLRTTTATFHMMDVEDIARIMTRLNRKAKATTKPRRKASSTIGTNGR